MELELIDNKHKLNISTKNKKLIGIYSTKSIINLFDQNNTDNYKKITKITNFININNISTNKTIYEYMIDIIRSYNLDIKNELKKIKDSLKLSFLNHLDINRYINTLSTSEKTLLTLSISLIFNPEIIVLEDTYLGLDRKNTMKLNILFNKLIDDYNIKIILIDKDINKLYKYTNHIYYNNKLVKNKDLYLEDVDEETISFIKKVKDMKNIKLTYYKDVRDIIKDIYKSIKR